MQSLHQQFSLQARRRPDAIALTEQGRSLSYGALEARANRIAHWLIAQHVGPETIVGLCLDQPREWLAAMLGIMKAGGAWLPLDPALPSARLQRMLSVARPPVVLSSLAWRSRFGTGETRVLSLDAEVDALSGQPDSDPGLGVSAEQLCYVMFTSGSTGEPKGVLVTHGNVSGLFAPFLSRFALSADDVWTLAHSFSFGYSVWETFGALAQGGRLVAVPPALRADPQALRELVESQAVTVLSQTPSAFRQNLLDDAWRDLDGLALRLVALSGEAVPAEDLRRWFARHADQSPLLIGTYAITETGGQVTCREYSATDSRLANPRSIGKPLEQIPVCLLGKDGVSGLTGDVGELCIGGAGVARGYLGDAALTAERFVDLQPAGLPAGRYYRSGDRARILADGSVEFLGREDAQFKWRGHRIEPGDIEAALQAHPGVREAAVAIRHSPAGLERLVGYYVPQPSAGRADGEPEFWPAVGPYQVYDGFLYDLMSAEDQRLACYRQGLAAARDRVVLDIGTGEHAVLARLAAEAGARHVYAVEVLEDAAARARAVVARLGLSDRITVISGDIATLRLPEAVELCTQGIIGNIGSADGIVPLWNAAKTHFAPGCLPVPARCETFIAPVELPNALRQRPAFSALARSYAERVFAAQGGPFDIRLCLRNFAADGLLADPLRFEDLDFSASLPVDDQGAGEFRFSRDGRLDGFLLWTRVTAVPGATIDYLHTQQGWLPVFLPLPEPGPAVSAGDVLRMRWQRRTAEGICPDYELAGEAGDWRFRLVSRHRETALNGNWLYQALWSAAVPVSATAGELRQWLESRVPEYMLPTAWRALPALPLNSSGKLDREALPAPSRERSLDAVATPPADALERQLADLWAEVLDLDAVGVDDNFFDLGGDSIAAVRLTSAMQRRLDRAVGLASLFDAPTVAGLAAALRAAAPQPGQPVMERGEL